MEEEEGRQWQLCDTCELATLIVHLQYILNVIKVISLAARAGSISQIQFNFKLQIANQTYENWQVATA